MKATSWSVVTKIMALLSIVGGLLQVVYAIFNGFAWGGFIVAVFYVVTGIVGLKAGYSFTVRTARHYLLSLIFSTVILLSLSTIYTIVVGIGYYRTLCRKMEYIIKHDCDSDTIKLYFLLGGVAEIFLTLVCCSGLMCCATGYMRALSHENIYIFETTHLHEKDGPPVTSRFVQTQPEYAVSSTSHKYQPLPVSSIP
ncbi:hypothetical protein QOT17_005062 [Balamuthia mandrillaris]